MSRSVTRFNATEVACSSCTAPEREPCVSGRLCAQRVVAARSAALEGTIKVEQIEGGEYLSSAVFDARTFGRCKACEDSITPGQRIRAAGYIGFVHDGCVTAPARAEARGAALTGMAKARAAIQEKRAARIKQAKALRASGMTIKQIATEMGAGTSSVGTWLRAGD